MNLLSSTEWCFTIDIGIMLLMMWLHTLNLFYHALAERNYGKLQYLLSIIVTKLSRHIKFQVSFLNWRRKKGDMGEYSIYYKHEIVLLLLWSWYACHGWLLYNMLRLISSVETYNCWVSLLDQCIHHFVDFKFQKLNNWFNEQAMELLIFNNGYEPF